MKLLPFNIVWTLYCRVTTTPNHASRVVGTSVVLLSNIRTAFVQAWGEAHIYQLDESLRHAHDLRGINGAIIELCIVQSYKHW